MTNTTSDTPRGRRTSETTMERMMARLDRLEDEKRQTLRELTDLKQEMGALRARHVAGAVPGTPMPKTPASDLPALAPEAPASDLPALAPESPLPAHNAPPPEVRSSRRGLLRTALGAAAATVGVGTLLETQREPALAATPNRTLGQTTFASATSTPTVTIKNTGSGLGLSTANGVSLGATTVVSLSASGAVSGQSVDVGAAMSGTNSSTVANAIALSGVVSSATPGSSSAAVRGQNNGTGGAGIGIWGSQAGSGYGVLGTSASGGIGVYGKDGGSGFGGSFASASGGVGVYGADGGAGRGGAFQSSGGTAVYAIDTGSGLAGYFTTNAGSTGVVVTTVSSGSTAISATGGDATGGVGVYGSGAIGLYGVTNATSGIGVSGAGLTGVTGDSSAFAAGVGVSGLADAATGIGAEGYAFTGLYGYSTANLGGATGGSGVYGAGDNAYTTGWAGYFEGDAHVDQDLYVSRNIYKAGGSFLIDHPLDPANKYLIHSFVESSERLNVYSGVATLGADGTAQVTLPAWFDALNRDYRYQLTPIGATTAVLYIAQEIAQNQFVIAGGAPGQRVSWQVSGVRQDAWATAHPMDVEVDKTGEERGTYLHPELFGSTARVPRMAPAPARPRPKMPKKPSPVVPAMPPVPVHDAAPGR